jgi:3-dehydroquinate synthase
VHREIEVSHRQGRYTIAFDRLENTFQGLSDAFFVTDTQVASHWRSLIPSSAKVLELPPGEQTKSLIWLERICSWLADEGATRSSVLVAFGGGVIGDLAGFAAAAYMRGIPYIQAPTTLLAQVDSSVGGKVAVDLPQGKNLIGAFNPPDRVAIDTQLISTLSLRQFRSGMAEVCKYGFILDRPLADELRSPLKQNRIPDIVFRCVELKKEAVEADEFETNGIRAKLNFGHTVGHALEQITGYGHFLHGEAIAVGMVAEAILGEDLEITPPGTSETVRSILETQGLPVRSDLLARSEELLAAMKRDKKAKRGALAFSLLTEIGGCKLVEGVGESQVLSALHKV